MDEETLAVETDEDENVATAESDDDDKSEKSVSSDLIRGHINTIILRALYDGDKYGYEIIAEIERKSSGQYSLKQPSLYSALKRLEKDGYITSYWGGSVGGGRRKYFSLTDEGKAVSEQNQAEWEYSRTIIDSLISDRDFDFNRPAPTAVDMRVLRKSTSRVPSREDDEDELLFEPAFDDTALREKLEEETKRKQEELETAYNDKLQQLEAEHSEKIAALDRERSDLETEKARFIEENAARQTELNDSYVANLKQLAIIREQQEALLQAKREELEQELETERARLEAEKAEHETARSEADESLKNELELQKKKYDEEAEEHARALQTLKDSNEQAMAEQKEACDATLRSERELHERDLKELSEKHEQEIEGLQDAAKQEKENAVRLARQEEERLFDDRLQAEKNRYNDLLTEERNRYNTALSEESARHEAQIRDDRMRYQQALDDQIAALRRQMELEMAEREKQIIHRNYISLVDSPASARQNAYVNQPSPSSETQPKETEDYQSVVSRLYENSVRSTAKTTENSAGTPVSGIDFRDIEKRASRDGLRVETVGGEAETTNQKNTDDVNTVHKGKALFLSAVVVFFWSVLVGGITMGLRGTLTIPVFYPYLMWCLGVVFLLSAGLMYANHFGYNRLRRSSPALINAIVIYSLIVIVSLIIALSVRIDFADISQLMTYVLLPAIYFVSVLIFGICYFFQVRPKK